MEPVHTEQRPSEQHPGEQASAAGAVTARVVACGPVRTGRVTHALLLVAALAVPVLGWLMAPLPGGRVALAGLEPYPLPTFCLSRRLGWECPTCGVTRSVIALVHGKPAASISQHRFGWLILLNILVQIPYRGYRLMRPGRPLPRLEQAGLWMFLGTGVIVVANRFFEAFGLL